MLLHLYLKEVLLDFIPSDLRERGLFDKDACCLVFLNEIRVDYTSGLGGRQNPRSLVSLDGVLANEAL